MTNLFARRLKTTVMAVALFLVTAAQECSWFGPSPPPPPCDTTGLTVSPSSASIDIGGSVTLQLSLTRNDPAPIGGCRSLLMEWSNNPPGIVAVTNQSNESAIITGIAPGTATITASTGSSATPSRSVSIAITVLPVTVQQLLLSPTSLTLAVGSRQRITPTVLDPAGQNITSVSQITWTSANPLLASVSIDGEVSGVAEGVTQVTATATAMSGTATAMLDVTVAGPPGITIIGPARVRVRENVELLAKTLDANGQPIVDPTITWSSSAPTKATAAANPSDPAKATITGVAPGAVTITARSASGKQGTFDMIVDPGPVASIVVTPSLATVRAGSFVQLTALARDADGFAVPDQTFAWTSLDPTVATVNASTGLVTTTGAGPVDIIATIPSVPNVAGQSDITVLAQRIAYAVADQPQTASYTPSPSFNSGGAAMNITRAGVGRYTVAFPGQVALAGETETMLVSGYGPGTTYCKLAGWGPAGPNDITADVRCFAFGGTVADGSFSIMLLGDHTLAGRFGFAFADQPNVTQYTPAKSFNSGGLNPPPVRVNRDLPGVYRVEFPGNAGAALDAEAIHVTAVGTGNERCNLATAFIGDFVRVRCYDGSLSQGQQGPPVDTRFTITLLDRGRGQRAGYAFTADVAGDEFETPGTYPLHSSNAYTTTVTRAVDVRRLASEGRYEVIFRGLAPAGATLTLGAQVVNKDSDEANYCKLQGWSAVATDLVVTVQCYGSADGLPEDEAFYVIVIW